MRNHAKKIKAISYTHWLGWARQGMEGSIRTPFLSLGWAVNHLQLSSHYSDHVLRLESNGLTMM